MLLPFPEGGHYPLWSGTQNGACDGWKLPFCHNLCGTCCSIKTNRGFKNKRQISSGLNIFSLAVTISYCTLQRLHHLKKGAHDGTLPRLVVKCHQFSAVSKQKLWEQSKILGGPQNVLKLKFSVPQSVPLKQRKIPVNGKFMPVGKQPLRRVVKQCRAVSPCKILSLLLSKSCVGEMRDVAFKSKREVIHRCVLLCT